MNRFRNAMLGTGLAASGCASFVHTAAVICISLFAADASGYPNPYGGVSDVLILGAAFFIYEAAYAVYIIRLLRSRVSILTKIRHPHLRFILDTAAEMILVFLMIIISEMSIHPALKAAVIFSLAFLASSFFLAVSRIIANLFLVRLLCGRTVFLSTIADGKTVSAETLYLSAERQYSHCERFNTALSLIGIRLAFPSMPAGEKEFHIKRIGVDLVENARNYEPWALIAEKAVFLCVIQARDSIDLNLTLQRYEAVIRKSVASLPAGTAPEIRFASETFTAAAFESRRNESAGAVIRAAFDGIIKSLCSAGKTVSRGNDQ